MSPFKSYKYTGRTAASSSLALEGVDTLGIGITSNNAETWSSPTYNYMAFRANGSFQITRSGKIDICMVGGGGAGGGGNNFEVGPVPLGNPSQCGGGGGAGGFLERYNVSFSKGTYKVDIGYGGSGVAPGNGSPTTVLSPTGFGFTAYGGGRGGLFNTYPATNGGSGGGGSGADINRALGDYLAGSPTVQIPTPLRSPQPQGYPGAYGGDDYPSYSPGAFNIGFAGGGGGASEAGRMTSSPNSAAGGAGGAGERIFDGDPGIPPSYGTPAPPSYAPGRYVAGGGAGGGVNASPVGASGGVGGGGPATASGSPQVPGTPGTQNTGGGGGGGGDQTWTIGGNGGPGLVIIRWKKNSFTR